MQEPCGDQERFGNYGHILTEYSYLPLLPQHIRLLFIGACFEELSIIHTSLITAPRYTSVSYSWDDQRRDHDLQVGGRNLKVTPSMRFGLPQLIEGANTQFLWIDAICIDQGNEEERANQIPQMREIYTRCRECLVWLGNGTTVADIAMDVMPIISQNIKLHSALDVWKREGIDVRSPATLDSSLWKGLVDIFSRSWFRRVWTFQECVLPDDIYLLCGLKRVAFTVVEPLAIPLLHHSTSLQLLSNGADLGKAILYKGVLRIFRIAEFKRLSKNPTKCLDTLRLLYFTRLWASSDRLDKIFGILGLADSSLKAQLRVDYTSTYTQISRQIAKWYISSGEDLYILNLASSVRNDEDQLPSWIPNIPQLGYHWCFGIIWQRFRTGMNLESVPRPFASVLSGELHVHGISVDLVSQVVPYLGKLDPDISTAEKCRNILDWEESCLAISRTIFRETISSVPEAHWTTFISGICGRHLAPNQETYDSLMCFLERSSTGKCLPPELESRSQDFAIQIRRLSQVSRVGKFFCTQDGRIGLGPINTQPGDHICVFYNGFTPFILRQTPELGSRYRLVGDSYTWSLMNGEPFQAETRKPDKVFMIT